MTDSREKHPRGPTPPRPEPVVGTRAYDIARWLLERTARFPARLLQRGERALSTDTISRGTAVHLLAYSISWGSRVHLFSVEIPLRTTATDR